MGAHGRMECSGQHRPRARGLRLQERQIEFRGNMLPAQHALPGPVTGGVLWGMDERFDRARRADLTWGQRFRKVEVGSREVEIELPGKGNAELPWHEAGPLLTRQE